MHCTHSELNLNLSIIALLLKACLIDSGGENKLVSDPHFLSENKKVGIQETSFTSIQMLSLASITL